MYTSDNVSVKELTDNETQRICGYYKTAFIDLMIGTFLGIFGFIYEQFSHGVFSFYVLHAFLIFLLFGAVPFIIMHRLNFTKGPGTLATTVYHTGLATLTAGCLVYGILEIYGTANHLVPIYFAVGFVITGTGIVLWPMVMAFRKLQKKAY